LLAILIFDSISGARKVNLIRSFRIFFFDVFADDMIKVSGVGVLDEDLKDMCDILSMEAIVG